MDNFHSIFYNRFGPSKIDQSSLLLNGYLGVMSHVTVVSRSNVTCHRGI